MCVPHVDFQKLLIISESYLSFPKDTWFFKNYLSFPKVTYRSQKLLIVSKNYLSFLKVTYRFQKLLLRDSASHILFSKLFAGGIAFHMMFLKVTRRKRCVQHNVFKICHRIISSDRLLNTSYTFEINKWQTHEHNILLKIH